MSSITPPSFIDDGTAFPNRRPPSNIAKWLATTSSPSSDTASTSTYTGSYVDDGADMLLPSQHRPGFGAIDARFYKQRKRRDGETCRAWNEDIQRAVAGDIGRSLEGLRGVGGVDIRPANGAEGERRGGRKDTVTVPLPRRWGTIVIKDESGRVIVVDEEGEFDSRSMMEDGNKEGGKWIKAASTISGPSVEGQDRVRKEKRKKENIPEPANVLQPILESEYEDVPGDDTAETDSMSPTDFFMTGGASGWPTPKTSSGAYSPTKTFNKSKKGSPTWSLPGSWPSPPQSPTKNLPVSGTSSVASNSKQSWGKESSHHFNGSRRPQNSMGHNGDNVSVKTYSTYKPVTVEDAPDTSSDNASMSQDVGWQDDHKGSEGGGSGRGSSSSISSKRNSAKSWKGTEETWANDEQHNIPATQDWTGQRVKTASEASSRASRRRIQRSHTPSEASWDGYERPKTESEVSVVGTDSERYWSGSQVSSRHSRVLDESRQYSQSGSRHESHAGWGDSDGWGGSQTANVDGWGGTGIGSGSGIGKDDIDEMSEEGEGWSSLKIKVKSRRESVGEWQ
ncbi:hypothetical protein IQ06DRAFT_377911 [Phaeosphaeriaceae sp. SRC1lsM3a]|nr:hypothetical protein IQ06DRAFT_377911 [Stagonospora sp. SRC1lsM3a]